MQQHDGRVVARRRLVHGAQRPDVERIVAYGDVAAFDDERRLGRLERAEDGRLDVVDGTCGSLLLRGGDTRSRRRRRI